MEGHLENGPQLPKTEAEKIGEALFAALKKQFPLFDNWLHHYSAVGSPREVKIRFHPHNPTDNINKQGQDFLEATHEIIDMFEIDNSKVSIEYQDNGQSDYSIFIRTI